MKVNLRLLKVLGDFWDVISSLERVYHLHLNVFRDKHDSLLISLYRTCITSFVLSFLRLQKLHHRDEGSFQ